MLLFLTECVFQGSPDLGLEYPGYKEETETQRERKKKKKDKPNQVHIGRE